MAARELFEVPNLDGLSINPADLYTAASVFGQLAAYAGHKADAMKHRMAGDIECATAHEKNCDRIYRQLPEWARW